jgi:hypothetical protein
MRAMISSCCVGRGVRAASGGQPRRAIATFTQKANSQREFSRLVRVRTAKCALGQIRDERNARFSD